MRPQLFVHAFAAVLLALVVPISMQAQGKPLPPPVPEQLPSSGAPYTVGPQDVLKIQVYNEDQLSGSYRVDADGSINYAVLGRVRVAGRTEREIGTLIEKMLADGYINKPIVVVQVEQYRSRTIFIAGEVRTPGKYPLQGDNSTLLEVLALAGSLTSNAGNDVIVVRPRSAEGRAMPSLPDASEPVDLLRIDLKAIEEGRMSGNIQLQDGDTIFVPRAEKFYISGQVRSPGAYAWTKGLTVQQAIAVAGGLTERGSNRRIKIRREVKPGSGVFTEIGVRLTDVVMPNDTITVPQRLI